MLDAYLGQCGERVVLRASRYKYELVCYLCVGFGLWQ